MGKDRAGEILTSSQCQEEMLCEVTSAASPQHHQTLSTAEGW